MGVLKGLAWDPTAFSTANGVNFARTVGNLGQGFGWSFMGDGKKYSGIRAHIGSTAGGLGSSLKIKLGIYKCRGSAAGSSYPQGTVIGRAHTTRSWVNASVKSWMTFTFGTASGWQSTAGVKYWVVASPVSWANGDLLRFTHFTGYTDKRFAVPHNALHTSYCFRTYQSDKATWLATAARIPAMYLVEATSGTKSYLGWPYHNLQTYTMGRATPVGVSFYVNTSCVLSSVAAYVKGAGSNRVLHLTLFSGTNLSFPSANKVWEATAMCVFGSGYGWKTFTGPTTALPYGYYTIAASSAPNTSLLALPYVMSENRLSGNDTYLSSTYKGYRKTTFYSTTDSMFRINISSSFTTFYARSRDWYFNTVQPGTKIVYYYGNTAVCTHYTNSTGWSKFASVARDRSSKFVPSYGTWIYNVANRSTPYWSSAKMTAVASATFIKGPDTDVPNVATPFAFRQLLLVSSAHTALGRNYLVNCNIRTGALKIAGSNGHYNESMGAGGGTGIAYFQNKTHIVWRQEMGEIWGNTWNHATKSWQGDKYLSNSLSAGDSHYAPHITIDKNGYIHLVHCPHGDLASTWMMSTSNDLVGSSRKIHTANAASGGTYNSCGVTSNNTIYMFYRNGVSNSKLAYCQKRDASNTVGWSSGVDIVTSTINGTNAKSVYFNGPFVDRADSLHVSFSVLENYGDTPYKCWGVNYMYSPVSSVSASTSEPGHYWYAANGSVVAVIIRSTNQPLRFRTATCAATLIHTVGPRAEYAYTQNRYLFSNIKDAIAAHQNKVYSSGTLSNYRPYVTFSLGTTANPNGDESMIAWYDPTAPNKNSRNWVVRSLTTAVAYRYVSSVRSWYYRHNGPILIDHRGIVRTYATSKYLFPKQSSATWAGEVFEWSSEDYGANWNGKYLTSQSNIGVPMINVKQNTDNQIVELAFCRGRDIHYFADASIFPHFRDSGSDIAVVFSGTVTPKVVDSVANYYNFSTSEIVFALHTSIAKNYPCSTAGQYYIYYGRALSTPLASNPRNIYHIYENFEQGNQVYSTALFNSASTNPNSWNYINKVSYATAAVATTAWRIIGSYRNDPVPSLKNLQHTNKIYAGDRALLSWTGTSDGKQYISTCYVYTAVPSKWRRNIAIEGSIWYEDSGVYNAMIGFTVGSTHTIVGVRVGQTGQFGYFNGTEFRSTTGVASDVYPDANHYQRFKATIIGTAFNCYANNSATSIGYIQLPAQCSAQRLIICRPNLFPRSSYQGGHNFIDYIKSYPIYSGTYYA